MEQKKNLRQGWESHPLPGNKASAAEKSSFGGVVTPVKVESLYQALSHHPEREFANKLFSELSGRGLGLVILVLDPHAFQVTYLLLI